jgi:uncharacterized protein YcbK (DUF882 family)
MGFVMASCTATSDNTFFGFDPSVSAGIETSQANGFDGQTINSAASAFDFDETDPTLPDAVADRPELRTDDQLIAEAPAQQEGVETAGVAAETATALQVVQPEADGTGESAPQVVATADTQTLPQDIDPQRFAAPAEPQQQQVAEAAPEKRGFLAAFFSPSSAQQAPSSLAQSAPAKPLVDMDSAAPAVVEREAPRALIQTASTTPIVTSSTRAALNAEVLPGVRESLFEINRGTGASDDDDIDLHEGGGIYQVASAAGLARLAPNGLLRQHDDVDVSCLKPSLVRVLKTIENHFGRKMIVTSGFRDSDRNRRARGARNSLHMYCAAADVQIPGVSKAQLAAFVRAMPGRGGVGTYCHTDSVHIDVGPERDWNWRCRRRG